MKILTHYHLAVKWLMEIYNNKLKYQNIDQQTWDKKWEIYQKYKPKDSNLPNEYLKYFKFLK